jgi:hypothetical protein
MRVGSMRVGSQAGYLAALSVIMLGLSFGSAVADPGLDGTWSGSGYVVPKDGARESVRCRVRFDKQSATVYAVSATCQSASTDIVQTGEVIAVSGGRYVGDFYNAQYDVSGRIKVQVSGNHQTVTFSGSRGQGSLSLTKQ